MKHKNTDTNGVNKQETHTPNTQRKLEIQHLNHYAISPKRGGKS